MSINWTTAPNGNLFTQVDYQLKDEKGRAVGGHATIELPENHRCNTEDAVGRFYVRINAARNGLHFGALTYGTFHATLDDAKKAATKKLKAAQKRFTKKFGVKVVA